MKNNILDLKIYGQGSSAGGKFNEVIIKGMGQINGDVECNNLKSYGEAELNGNLKTENYIIIKGQIKINGNLDTKNLKIQGEMEVKGPCYVDEADITGSIRSETDFNVEVLELEGGFVIGGMINAEKLKINMHWPCKVREIGGADISVKKDAKLSFLGLKNMIMPNDTHKTLEVDIIEGDNIYLENTIAKVVRGKNITLGSGCKIELVEYTENFKHDDKAEISTQNKI
jgi:cytoskeletal protein CcmA (bactofilin family)